MQNHRLYFIVRYTLHYDIFNPDVDNAIETFKRIIKEDRSLLFRQYGHIFQFTLCKRNES